jgi:hypothetical protein
MEFIRWVDRLSFHRLYLLFSNGKSDTPYQKGFVITGTLELCSMNFARYLSIDRRQGQEKKAEQGLQRRLP